MKTCDFCGNLVPSHLNVCPYCQQALNVDVKKSKPIKVVSLQGKRIKLSLNSIPL